MHDNSMIAINQLTDSGKRKTRLEMIMEIFEDGKSYTDEQILQKIKPGSDNRNLVSPRLNDGIEKGLLVEVGTVRNVYGWPVRVLRKASITPQQNLF